MTTEQLVEMLTKSVNELALTVLGQTECLRKHATAIAQLRDEVAQSARKRRQGK